MKFLLVSNFVIRWGLFTILTKNNGKFSGFQTWQMDATFELRSTGFIYGLLEKSVGPKARGEAKGMRMKLDNTGGCFDLPSSMTEEIEKLDFKKFENGFISNVTAKEISDSSELKNLLVKNLESRVRWRESVLLMANKGINQFIEIGPGKVLSGLIKRIDRNLKVSAINTEEDIKQININNE